MKRSLSFENVAATGLLFIGAIFRLRQYFTGRSLWTDEAMLALNIVNRNFAGLFKPLDLNQGAPVGFLLIEKLFNTLLGRNELVLRLFPLIAGLVSLGLFYVLLKQLTTNTAGRLAALALFALNPQLIYYSSETKQYIVDVAVTVGLLVLAWPVLNQKANRKDYWLLGIVGILAMWLSHPAFFVLAGIGVTLVLQLWQKRDWSNLRLTFLLGVFWLLSFALLYFINLRTLRANSYLTDYWSEAFLPMPPWSHLIWFSDYVEQIIQIQLGIPYLLWLAALCMVVGWFMLYREVRPLALTFLFITLLAFVASALKLYPAFGRLALFMTPLWIVLLGKSVEWIQRLSASNKIASTVTTLALSGFLILNPLNNSTRLFITPKYFEHIRPYMDYLSASWKNGDELFVTYWAEPAFRYYAPFYHLENIQYTSSQYADYSNPQMLKARFDSLIGKKRVWVLFSHVYQQGNFNERDFLTGYLDSIGKKTRELRIPDTSVYLYLYDLSR